MSVTTSQLRPGSPRWLARWLPRSRTARRRLWAVAFAAPLVAGATALALYALGDTAVYFYSPAQAAAKAPPLGRAIRLGGLVQAGSLARSADGSVAFTLADRRASDRVLYRGELPDLFREGQGVVTEGAFTAPGVFQARQVLAKHDERYMPREVADALKRSGEWRGDAGAPAR